MGNGCAALLVVRVWERQAMRRFKTRLMVAGLAAAAAVSTGAAQAQSSGYGQPYRFWDDGYSDTVPNVPDERGCVKWCFQDRSPCDPPEYKRADHRCSNFD